MLLLLLWELVLEWLCCLPSVLQWEYSAYASTIHTGRLSSLISNHACTLIAINRGCWYLGGLIQLGIV